MSAYYHDLVTEKSWKLLLELHREYPFVLIGGWARCQCRKCFYS
jgi:hypothetical protein